MPEEESAGFDARKLTWAAMLGHWVSFARSAVALPPSHEGERLRASVPDLVMLQAVWFALRDLGELPPDERALGLDRAHVLIEKHAAALDARWDDEPPPEMVRELIHDAWRQLHAARAEHAT